MKQACPRCGEPVAEAVLHECLPVGIQFVEQPIPNPGKQGVTDELIRFLRERQEKGIATYGRSLETFNGRDAQRDALEESLDLNQYIFQMYLEQKTFNQQLVNELNELRGIKNQIFNIISDPNCNNTKAFRRIYKLVKS